MLVGAGRDSLSPRQQRPRDSSKLHRNSYHTRFLGAKLQLSSPQLLDWALHKAGPHGPLILIQFDILEPNDMVRKPGPSTVEML